jgi:hypothetical protein
MLLLLTRASPSPRAARSSNSGFCYGISHPGLPISHRRIENGLSAVVSGKIGRGDSDRIVSRRHALNASLKKSPEVSSTGELAELVLENMAPYGISGEVIRLADRNIPCGLGYREGPGDDWPEIVSRIKASDIVLFATPIWWGGRSSLMQRVI